MRVIAGTARGRRLEAPRGRLVRPTADRVKEALFSALGSRVAIDGAVVLDLFAGSGALGIEALSRGAAAVTFVEQDAGARRALQANLERCGLAERGRILGLAAHAAVRRLAGEGARFDGLFMDPPYGRELVDQLLGMVAEQGILRPAGWAVAEHAADDRLRELYGDLRLTTAKRYGITVLSLFMGARTRDDVAET
jgi:16S rRNA (guanine(966)-N(2))-methyltransferase RsmD